MPHTASSKKAYLHQRLIDDFNDKLQLYNPCNNAQFDDDLWTFRSRFGLTNIDFSIFRKKFTRFIEHTTLTYEDKEIVISVVEFAKLLFLEVVRTVNISDSGGVVADNLALLFSFMAENQCERLQLDDLKSFYTLMLTMDATTQGLRKRLSPPAYRSRLNKFNERLILQTLSKYKLNLLLPMSTYSQRQKALNKACRDVMDMTLSDYKEGGTFNLLGLDVGRHYLDYCTEVFEEQYTYTCICRTVIHDIFVTNRQNNKKHKNLNLAIVSDLLLGVDILSPDYSKIKKKIKDRPDTTRVSKQHLEYMRNTVYSLIRQYHLKIAIKTNAFKLDIVNKIVKRLGLPERFDNQEFVRVMMFTKHYGEFSKPRKNILSEYKSSLSSSGVKVSWGMSELDAICNKESQVQPLNTDDAVRAYCRAHIRKTPLRDTKLLTGNNLLSSHGYLIESAGTAMFVGITGWRSSEFGFPLNSIKVSVNHDILDSTYVPYRFNVNWVVPKTSSTTPLNREITLASYILCAQMDALNIASSVRPALYFQSNHFSKNVIPARVGSLWSSFADRYSIFIELDTLEHLKSIKERSVVEDARFKVLTEKFDLASSATKSLLDIRDTLRSDWPRYHLLNYTIKKWNVTFTKMLEKYGNNSLDPEATSLFDSYLSAGTRQTLKSKNVVLNRGAVRAIRDEFAQDMLHPSPHAFRHMWAEAVLRRYRGDVGKFIRANFKHLDESFFMAYLRDKQTKAVYQVATRTVILSVVRQQILSLTDDSRDYAGPFDRYISKAVKLTKVVSHEKYLEVANKISTNRIISMKSNPWSSCFLRVGSETVAKCAENGVPQRRNASPKLCLGCTNANIAEGNYRGIVAYIRYDIDACRNPKLPVFIKAPHLQTVKLALKRINELRKNSGSAQYNKFIAYLNETILIAQQSSEAT